MSEFSYDKRTALIVIDVQNDFADPKGSRYVPGGEEVVPVLNAEIELALAAGARIIYSRDWHPPTKPRLHKQSTNRPAHWGPDNWGSLLHPSLRVEGPVISKGDAGEEGYSAFCARDPRSGVIRPSDLGGLLAGDGISQLVVGGLSTEHCVRATVLDALNRHYPVRVLRAAVRALDQQPGDGARALEEMAQAGAVLV